MPRPSPRSRCPMQRPPAAMRRRPRGCRAVKARRAIAGDVAKSDQPADCKPNEPTAKPAETASSDTTRRLRPNQQPQAGGERTSGIAKTDVATTGSTIKAEDKPAEKKLEAKADDVKADSPKPDAPKSEPTSPAKRPRRRPLSAQPFPMRRRIRPACPTRRSRPPRKPIRHRQRRQSVPARSRCSSAARIQSSMCGRISRRCSTCP